MKTKVLAFALAGVFALNASAQEVKSASNLADQPGKNVTFQQNKVGDNWFISLRGGTNLALSFSSIPESADVKTFSNRLGYGASFGFGKWFSPYFASRIMIDWNMVRNPLVDKVESNSYHTFHTLNPHIDFMFNPANYFGAYKADRVVSFAPYIGVGAFAYRIPASEFTTTNPTGATATNKETPWLSRNNYSLSAHLGFDLGFRLGRVVELVVAPQVVFTNMGLGKNLDSPYRGNDMLAKVDLGFNFNVGKSDFEVIEPMDYALVNSLQSEINSLRSQNAELSKRPVSCPECPTVAAPVETKIKSENVVYFRIGSAKVDRNQMINIFNTAEFVKANNVPVTVVGYADAKTGSSNYNLQLSEKRAREVARILTDEYGVPSSQINIDYKGDGTQPYAENAWNRIVIMTAEK